MGPTSDPPIVGWVYQGRELYFLLRRIIVRLGSSPEMYEALCFKVNPEEPGGAANNSNIGTARAEHGRQ